MKVNPLRCLGGAVLFVAVSGPAVADSKDVNIYSLRQTSLIQPPEMEA